jgi:hypothetical protein
VSLAGIRPCYQFAFALSASLNALIPLQTDLDAGRY